MVRHAEVVDGGDFIEVRDRLDGYQQALAADQLIPHLQFTHRDKTFLSGYVERRRRCARAGEDRAGEQESNSGRSLDLFLFNPLQLPRTVRIKLAARQNHLAYLAPILWLAIIVLHWLSQSKAATLDSCFYRTRTIVRVCLSLWLSQLIAARSARINEISTSRRSAICWIGADRCCWMLVWHSVGSFSGGRRII